MLSENFGSRKVIVGIFSECQPPAAKFLVIVNCDLEQPHEIRRARHFSISILDFFPSDNRSTVQRAKFGLRRCWRERSLDDSHVWRGK